MGKYVGDFETTGEEKYKRDGTSIVWAVGLCEVGAPDNTFIFTSLDDFMSWCENRPENDTIYFHNLKFDGNAIIQWLLNHDYKFISKTKDKTAKSFATIISDKGLWYQIEIWFKVRGNRVNKVTIRDSLKLIPLAVKDIAKSFRLPIQKGEIDYSRHDFLPEGSELTEEEKDYLIKDVQIVEHALNFFHENGMDKMTIGACALAEYKDIFSKKYFKKFFPPPFYDADVRQAYKGGFTYLEPQFSGKTLGNMVVLDKNSMYPSIMAGCNGEMLPFGTPAFFEGEYEEDKLYPLYIQHIRCGFDLKEGKIPTIQIKGDLYYQGNVYLTTSDSCIVDLYLTSVDLKLFLEQYDTYGLKYINGWKFRAISAQTLFGEYVEKWSKIKVKSKEDGNWGMYLIAKLMLNSLYGKFASATKLTSKEPYLGADGKLRFRNGETVEKDGIYIGMACFITAYARADIIRSAQKIKDDYNAGRSNIQFVYADTDSLHCISPDFKLPEGLDIDKTRLGAWDHEASAVKAKFLRQKCYIEKHIISEKAYNEAMADDDTVKEQYTKEGDTYYFTKITVAGMPEDCYHGVTFQNFKIGARYEGKLAQKTVYGGVILEKTDFTIMR